MKKATDKILKEFTKRALAKYGDAVVCIVLFGSVAREDDNDNSDLDLYIVIDNTEKELGEQEEESIEKELDELAREIDGRMNIQAPEPLTLFWRRVRAGTPIMLNILREGIPLYDRGVFLPLKKLLEQGQILPSVEAISLNRKQIEKRLKRVESHKLAMVGEDCHNAMVESAYVVIMTFGLFPPRPEKVPEMLLEVMTRIGTRTSLKDLEDVVALRKGIKQDKINDVSGEEVEKWIGKTKIFVQRMEKLAEKIERLKIEGPMQEEFGFESDH